jgi:hypothetical protein
VSAQYFEVRLEGRSALQPELLSLRLRRVLQRLGFPAPEVSIGEGPLPAKPTPFRRLWAGPKHS